MLHTSLLSLLQVHDQSSPLMVAARAGHEKVVEMLLSNKADVNQLNLKGDTALFLGVKQNHVAVVKVLVNSNARINIEHARSGWSPLFYACANLNLEMAELLLDSGADVDAVDQNEESPIWLTLKKGNVRLSRLLLQRKCTLIESRDGDSPISWARQEKDAGLVKLLLEFKHPIGFELHKAVADGTLQVVKEFVENGGMPLLLDAQQLDKNVYVKNGLKLSPFMVSLLQGKLNVAKYFLHIRFLRPEDLKFAKLLNRRKEHRFLSAPHTMSKEVLSFLIPLLSRPWSLRTLSFIRLSAYLGYDDRKARMEALVTDPNLRKQLMFEEVNDTGNECVQCSPSFLRAMAPIHCASLLKVTPECSLL